jgi:hypothetical protein
MSIKDWATLLLSRKYRSNVDTTAMPTTEQEIRTVIDSAEEFDKLVGLPGWEKACKYLVRDVQDTISEATQYKYEDAKMKLMVVRWDAKRELVDGLMAYIGDMQKERDRLIETYRGAKENG